MAEAIAEAPTEEQVVQQETPEAEPTKVSDQETTGLTTTDTEAVDTGSDGGEFKLDDQPEWKEALGTRAEAPKSEAAKELPGESLEAANERERKQRHDYLTTSFGPAVGNRFKSLSDKLGLTTEQAQELQTEAFNALNTLHGNYDSFAFVEWDKAVSEGLPEQSVKAFKDRKLSTRKDYVETIYALGLQAMDEAWKAKVEDGTYFTKKQVEEAGAKAVNAYERWLTENKRLVGTSSGDSVRGETPVGLARPYSQLTSEQRASMSPSERDAHIAQYGG